MKTRSSTLNRMKYTSSVLPREVEVDQDVMDSLKDGEKHKHHPGLLRLKTVTLPERIEKAISILIEKYQRPDIVERAQKLYNQLLCRQPLIEKMELRRRASKYESELMEKENIKFQVLTDETEKDALSKSLIKTVKKHIKNSVYHWKGTKYDTSLGLIYLVARAAPNYSILLQCMTEIKKRDPEFSPQSIYNHGSGIGSSVWAANAIWDKLVVEHYCVDPSGDMNSIARLLLQDGDNQKDMHVPGVYFRQFQPSADTNKFHLVVSAYCLMEHESMQERLTMVDNLWKLTDSYMILVENGTQAGHRLVMEARDYILQMQTQEEDSFSGHVFAPCPHDVGCPKLLREVPTPCTFQVHHTPLHLQSEAKTMSVKLAPPELGFAHSASRWIGGFGKIEHLSYGFTNGEDQKFLHTGPGQVKNKYNRKKISAGIRQQTSAFALRRRGGYRLIFPSPCASEYCVFRTRRIGSGKSSVTESRVANIRRQSGFDYVQVRPRPFGHVVDYVFGTSVDSREMGVSDGSVSMHNNTGLPVCLK
ncbi:hypothetical protein ScPMuIL_002536 [Solemya velum]